MTEKRKVLGRGLETLLPSRHAASCSHHGIRGAHSRVERSSRARHFSTSRSTSSTAILIRRAPSLSIRSRSRNSPLPSRRWECCSPSWCGRSRADAIRSLPASAAGRPRARSRHANHPRRGAPSLQPAGHGDDDRREPAAPRPDLHGGGPRLRPAGARVRPHPGADGAAHRQGTLLGGQLAAPAEAAGQRCRPCSTRASSAWAMPRC